MHLITDFRTAQMCVLLYVHTESFGTRTAYHASDGPVHATAMAVCYVLANETACQQVESMGQAFCKNKPDGAVHIADFSAFHCRAICYFEMTASSPATKLLLLLSRRGNSTQPTLVVAESGA